MGGEVMSRIRVNYYITRIHVTPRVIYGNPSLVRSLMPSPAMQKRTQTHVGANCSPFLITAANKSYKHQYANIYFVRLRILRRLVEERARERWKDVAGLFLLVSHENIGSCSDTGSPIFVPRVLEVLKSQLCWIVGTVYMDMPLKPNVLDDIVRDVSSSSPCFLFLNFVQQSIPPPPPVEKFHSGEDSVMLEDESGRIRLVGDRVRGANLVTGVILGALGVETPNGEFGVVDLCYSGMAPQTCREITRSVSPSPGILADEWIGLVSGLEIGPASPSEPQMQL